MFLFRSEKIGLYKQIFIIFLKDGICYNIILSPQHDGLIHHQCYSDVIGLRKTVISSMFYDIDKNNITSSYMEEHYIYLNYNNLRGLSMLRVKTSEEYRDIDKEKI